MLGGILPVMSIVSVIQGEVCYDHLGCFTEKSPWSKTLQRPISRLPWSPEKINTRFLLYTRNNPNTFQELKALQPKTIIDSNFKDSRNTRFIIHGFIANGEGDWLAEMCQAMLEVEDVNCICVDWRGGSVTLYSQAANNIRVVGAEVAYFVGALQKTFHYILSYIHIIGHGLGAHAAGEAGKRKPGIGRITGLDPAQPYFQGTPAEVRLDPSDATLVDAIHTDSTEVLLNLGFGGYGMSQTVGHLDFFPNGGKHMPGCRKTSVIKNGNLDDISDVLSDLAACNHLRSYKYYTESILTPDGFLAYPATSYDGFLGGAGFPCNSYGCPMMGHQADRYYRITPTTQTFYLNTGETKNFALWRYKVSVHIAGKKSALGSFAIALQGSKKKTKDLTIHKGIVKPDTTYTAFLDSEIRIRDITKVIFVWHGDIFGILRLRFGASTVTVQNGQDGAFYSFCDSATMLADVPQVLSPCSSNLPM